MSAWIQGFIIGVANIIPGVSGGTLALVLGIYERLIRALTQWTRPTLLRALGSALRFHPGSWRNLFVRVREADQFFLLQIGAGAVLAIAAASRLMAFVLRDYPGHAYAFFFGLVALSMVFPYKELRRKTLRGIICFLPAAITMIVLTRSLDDHQQIARAQHKLDRQQARMERTSEATAQPAEKPLISFESPGTRALVVVFLAAALAISAMILPGISGSFVLLLLGVYFDILLAINERQVWVLAAFALGALAGMLVFSGFLSFLLEKAYDATLSAMIGLMAGSLYALWPFREIARVGDQTLLLGHRFPKTWTAAEWSLVGWAILGGIVILASLALERRQKTKSAN